MRDSPGNDSVFQYEDYLAYLRARVDRGKAERGYLTRLANAAPCQISHLSHVLSGRAHLTPDQAAGIATFWGLTDDECDFFLELVTLGRAGSKNLEQVIRRRLARIRRRQENLSHRLRGARALSSDFQALYYSSWHWIAVHMATSIGSLHSVPAIAERLGLPRPLVQNTLLSLEAFQLVRREGECWRAANTDLHLPKNSPFTQVNHLNWRQRASHRIQAQDPGAIHYTAVQTMSAPDLEKFRETLREFISRTRLLGSEGAEEELVSFSCDLFRV